jgi:hypothetical protein
MLRKQLLSAASSPVPPASPTWVLPALTSRLQPPLESRQLQLCAVGSPTLSPSSVCCQLRICPVAAASSWGARCNCHTALATCRSMSDTAAGTAPSCRVAVLLTTLLFASIAALHTCCPAHQHREFYSVGHLKELLRYEARVQLGTITHKQMCKDVHGDNCPVCTTCHFCRCVDLCLCSWSLKQAALWLKPVTTAAALWPHLLLRLKTESQVKVG